MNLTEVKSKAKGFGIKIGRQNKEQLIKAIQVEEGNFDCFASASAGYCDQSDCIWRDDCFTMARKKHDA
jgi:hypothetical protein